MIKGIENEFPLDQHGIHVRVINKGNEVEACVRIPTGRNEFQMYWLTAPSQTFLLELVKPLLKPR